MAFIKNFDASQNVKEGNIKRKGITHLRYGHTALKGSMLAVETEAGGILEVGSS